MSDNTTRKRGVLFDLDGVLLDSEGNYTIFWAQMDKEFPTGIENFASYIKGLHLTRILGFFESDEVRQQVQDRLLDFVGVKSAAEMNWDMDILPIAEYPHEDNADEGED